MTTIEMMLRDAGAHAEWPPTPDLTQAVAARIATVATGSDPARSDPVVRVGRPRLRRPLALALAALLVLAGGAAAVPGIREPVLDFLGLRSVKIERVPRPLPVVPGTKLSLGRHTTLPAARRTLNFAPLVPSGLGDPVVYYDRFPPGGQLGLVYRQGRLFITEVQGRLETRFLFKFVGPGAKVDPVSVNGGRGLWLHGRPHQYAYADKAGEMRTDTVRLAGDVLLWRTGGVLLRLEGARSKGEALRIARSARAAP
jgi:hypothetical protein